MYTVPAVPTKKALKEAVARKDEITVNPLGTINGIDIIEGPKHPRPHEWYAQVRIIDGRVVEVLA